MLLPLAPPIITIHIKCHLLEESPDSTKKSQCLPRFPGTFLIPYLNTTLCYNYLPLPLEMYCGYPKDKEGVYSTSYLELGIVTDL